MKQVVIFLVACVVALVLVAPESKAGRSAEEMFDKCGAYIYDNEPANQAYKEAARNIERAEREYEINKIREERDAAKKDAGT